MRFSTIRICQIIEQNEMNFYQATSWHDYREDVAGYGVDKQADR